MIVCQGQIMMDRRNLMQDKFSMSKTLQQLIRISHEVSEEEGQRYLDLAVEEEWRMGSNQYIDKEVIVFFQTSGRTNEAWYLIT